MEQRFTPATKFFSPWRGDEVLPVTEAATIYDSGPFKSSAAPAVKSRDVLRPSYDFTGRAYRRLKNVLPYGPADITLCAKPDCFDAAHSQAGDNVWLKYSSVGARPTPVRFNG